MFNSTSNFFIWTLLPHTGAQYSVVLYTNAKADVQNMFSLHLLLVPTCLLIVLFFVFNLFFTPSRCFLKTSVLSNFIPRYFGASSHFKLIPRVSKFSFLSDSLLFRWNTMEVVLFELSVRYHDLKYFWTIGRSSFSIFYSFSKDSARATEPILSAYINFCDVVLAISDV